MAPSRIVRPRIDSGLVFLSLVLLVGCQMRPVSDADASTDSGMTGMTGTTGTSDGDDAADGETDGTEDSGDAADESSTGSALPGDGEPCELETPSPHCAPGLKCMPFSDDGTTLALGYICTPLDPDPAALGEPCEWVGGIFSGQDDCGPLAFCDDWGAFGDQTCTGLCEFSVPGDWSTATCEDSFSVREPACEGCFCTCRPSSECSPLSPSTCEPDQICVGGGPQPFECQSDASGPQGAVGDPCDDFDQCDYGNACINSQVVATCPGNAGCCAPFCRVSEPNDCPGAPEGEQCVPWYEEFDVPVPEALDDLGICMLGL